MYCAVLLFKVFGVSYFQAILSCEKLASWFKFQESQFMQTTIVWALGLHLLEDTCQFLSQPEVSQDEGVQGTQCVLMCHVFPWEIQSVY